jgi:predicted CopG family antitoxin
MEKDNIKNSKHRHILVSIENYEKLKRFGRFKDSFDDIITRILEASKNQGGI